MKDTAAMFRRRLAGMRVDGHAADRVANDFFLLFSNVAARHALVAGIVVTMLVVLV